MSSSHPAAVSSLDCAASPLATSASASAAPPASASSLPAAVAIAAAATLTGATIRYGQPSVPPSFAAAAAPSPSPSAAAAGGVAGPHRGDPLHLTTYFLSKQLASQTDGGSDATGSAMAAAPLAREAGPRKGGRTTEDLRSDAKAALAAFDATKDMGTLLHVLGFEEREVQADDWRSFTPAQIAAASQYLRVVELANKRQRTAVMNTGVLQSKVGLKPRRLATLYWCSRCADSRKPGPRTRIIQHILGHEEGASDEMMADDRADSGEEPEEEPAAGAASRARPTRLDPPVEPSSLPDPLGSAAAISFFPHDLSPAEVDELLHKHTLFNHSVATEAQREAVRENLVCVKLKDAAVRDAAFEATDADPIKLTGLSQLKTPHTSYYCRCLQYCFRNIGDMLTHILKTHCDQPVAIAAATARPRKRRRSIHASSDAVGAEADADLDPTLDSGAASHRLRKKQRGDGAIRRTDWLKKSQLNDQSRYYDRNSSDSESPDDSSASDSYMVSDDEGLASSASADSDSDSESGAVAGGAAKGSKVDSAAEIAGAAVARGSRQPILSRSGELDYMQQLQFQPAEPSRAQWKHLRSWREARANWPLVQQQIICQRVPRDLRSAHSFHKNQLLDVPGLSAVRDNFVLFSCRCGTQSFKRLTDITSLLRHILWRCPQTTEPIPLQKLALDKHLAHELYPPKSKQSKALKHKALAATPSVHSRASDAHLGAGGEDAGGEDAGGEDRLERDATDREGGRNHDIDMHADGADEFGYDDLVVDRDDGSCQGSSTAQQPLRARTPTSQASSPKAPAPPPQKWQQQQQQQSQVPAAPLIAAADKTEGKAGIHFATAAAESTTETGGATSARAAAEGIAVPHFSSDAVTAPSSEDRSAQLVAVAAMGVSTRTAAASAARQSLFGADGGGADGLATSVPRPDVAVAAAVAPLCSEITALTQQLSDQSSLEAERNAALLGIIASLQQQQSQERESLQTTLHQLSMTQKNLLRMAAEDRDARRKDADAQLVLQKQEVDVRRREAAARQEVDALRKLLHQSQQATQQQFASFMQTMQSQREVQQADHYSTSFAEMMHTQPDTTDKFDTPPALASATAVPAPAPTTSSSSHAAAAAPPSPRPTVVQPPPAAAAQPVAASPAGADDVEGEEGEIVQPRDDPLPVPAAAAATTAAPAPAGNWSRLVELAAQQMVDEDW